MGRDNISGILSKGIVKKIYLAPGKVIQWFMYIFVANLSYGALRQRTRLARSPIMTHVYSILSWAVLLFYLASIFGKTDQLLKYGVNPFIWSPTCYIVSKFTDENLSLKECYAMFQRTVIKDNSNSSANSNDKVFEKIDTTRPKGATENILNLFGNDK